MTLGLPPSNTRLPKPVALLLAIVWVMIGSALALAQEQTVDADRAMQSLGSPRWYDSENDQFNTPTVKDEPDSSIRRDGWVNSDANQKKKTAAQNGTTRGGWNFGLNGINADLFSSIVLIALATVLIGTIALITYYSLRNYLPGRWERARIESAIKIDPTRVTDLPFEAEASRYSNPLAEAQALFRAERYSEAIVFLYGYLLLALDQARKIELQKGKTNRMYLRELPRQSELVPIVQTCMLSFEEVFFGQHQISRERFLESWSSLERFHQLLASQPASTPAPAVEVSPS